MIKANELRIGNFVQTSIHSALKDFDFFKVTGKFIAQVEEMKNGEAVCYDPIPLSPEILEACGFEWNEGANVWVKTYGKNGNMFIRNAPEYSAYGVIFGQSYSKIVSTLHQLQNLYFAHTETELQVNLTHGQTHH